MSSARGCRAVAIGGGTGLPQVLRCLLDLGYEPSAVVTMADDGGSSGVLRRQLGMLPPGDVRNCLVALSQDEEAPVSRVFQYRFAEGEGLAGHSVGNLILAALADITGDFARAVEVASEALGVRGRVLPSTLQDVLLHGVDREGNEVFGQARLARNDVAVDRVFLEPQLPQAFGPALEAISQADVIVIGPGSLYTSIIPNFLIDGVAQAVCCSSAKRVYVSNVANLRGETHGLDAADHVRALLDHGLEGCIDLALVHVPFALCDDCRVEPVEASQEALDRIRAMGVEPFTADLADADEPSHHARAALAHALEEVLG